MTTREMTVDEERFYTHALANHRSDSAVVAFLRNQMKAGQDFQKQAGHLPICMGCQKACLWHGDGAMCSCGTFTPRHLALRLKEHVKLKMYR